MQFDLNTAQRLLRDPSVQIPTIAAIFGQSVASFAKYYKRHTERLEQAADGSSDPDGHNYGDYRRHHLPDGEAQGVRLEVIVTAEQMERIAPRVLAAMGSRGKFADALSKLLTSETTCNTTGPSSNGRKPATSKKTTKAKASAKKRQ